MDPKEPALDTPSTAIDSALAHRVNHYFSTWQHVSPTAQPTLTPTDRFLHPANDPAVHANHIPALSVQSTDLFLSHWLRRQEMSDVAPALLRSTRAAYEPVDHAPSRDALPVSGMASPPREPFTTFPADTWFSSSRARSDPSMELSVLPVLAIGTVEAAQDPEKNSALFCEVCEVLCDTQLQLEKHQEGQKHRRKSDIHRVFVEARKKFWDEGLKQIAPDVWTCIHCKAQVQGKTPVLQHIEAVKHKKNRNMSVGGDLQVGKGQKNARTPPRVAKASMSPRGRPAAAAMKQLNGDFLPNADEKGIGRGQQMSSAVHGAVGDKQHLSSGLFSPPRREKTVDRRELGSQSVHTSAGASTSDGAWSGWHRADGRVVFDMPPTFDPLRCPASSCVSPIRLASPNQNALFIDEPTARPTSAVSPRRRSGSMNKPGNQSKQSTPSKHDMNSLSCGLCNVRCNSVDTLSCHVASAKHKRRQALLESPQPANETVGTPSKGRVNRVFFNCEVCNVSCSGLENFESHLRGKLHSKRVRSTSAQGKPADSGINQ